MKRGNLLVVAQSALAVALVVLAVAVIVPPPRSARSSLARNRTPARDDLSVAARADEEDPRLEDSRLDDRDVERPARDGGRTPRDAAVAFINRTGRQPRNDRLATNRASASGRRPIERVADRGDRAFDVPPRRDPDLGPIDTDDSLPPPPPSDGLTPVERDDDAPHATPSQRVDAGARDGRRSRRVETEPRIELGPIDDTIGGVPYRHRAARSYAAALSAHDDHWINLRIVVEQPAARAAHDVPSQQAVSQRPPSPQAASRDAASMTSHVDARLAALSTQIESLGREQNARQQYQMERSARMMEKSQHATQLLELQRRLLALKTELGDVQKSAAQQRADREADVEAYRRDAKPVPAEAAPRSANPFDEPPANRSATPPLPVAPSESSNTGATPARSGLVAESNQGASPVSVATSTNVSLASDTARSDTFLAPVVNSPVAPTTQSTTITATAALSSDSGSPADRLPQINPGPPFHRRETYRPEATRREAYRPEVSRADANRTTADAQPASQSVAHSESRFNGRQVSAYEQAKNSSKPLPRYQLKTPIDAPDPPDVAAVPVPPDSRSDSATTAGDRAETAAPTTTNPTNDSREVSSIDTPKAADGNVASEPVAGGVTNDAASPTAPVSAPASAPATGVEAAPVATTPVACATPSHVNPTVANNCCRTPGPASPKPVRNGAAGTGAALTPSPDRAFSKSGSSKAPAPRTSSGPRGGASRCDVCSTTTTAPKASSANGVKTAAATSPQSEGTGSRTILPTSATTPAATTPSATTQSATAPTVSTPTAAKSAPVTPERNAIAKAQYSRARELFAAGDSTQATLHARRALEIRPDYPEARQLMSQIEAANRKPARSKLWPFGR